MVRRTTHATTERCPERWLARWPNHRRRSGRGTELRCVGRRSPCHNPPKRPAVLGRAQSEGTEIDIIFLVERLESIIANGKKLPLTNNVVIDQTNALELIDELRVAVPEEVRAAKRINSEGERIIEKAQEESERIVARAQEQAAFLIDERGLTQQAEADSRRIIAEAEQDAEEVRRGADEYAVSVLVGLEGDVVKTLQSIKKGIDLLDARRTDLRADEQNGTEEPENGWAPDAEYDDEEVELPVRR